MCLPALRARLPRPRSPPPLSPSSPPRSLPRSPSAPFVSTTRQIPPPLPLPSSPALRARGRAPPLPSPRPAVRRTARLAFLGARVCVRRRPGRLASVCGPIERAGGEPDARLRKARGPRAAGRLHGFGRSHASGRAPAAALHQKLRGGLRQLFARFLVVQGHVCAAQPRARSRPSPGRGGRICGPPCLCPPTRDRRAVGRAP